MSELTKEYIDDASKLEIEGYTTEYQTIIQLSKMIKNLEERIKILEGVKIEAEK